jgi:hypothetical protein
MSLSLTPAILKPYAYNRVFLETGTFTGGGVAVALECGFEKVISIEIEPKYFTAVRDRYALDSRVELYLGDSLGLLESIINGIDERITFFLDSHLAAGNKIGTVEVPLLRELEIIGNHPIKNHTIMIDDLRGFGYDRNIDPNLSEEWKNITKEDAINAVYSINPNYRISYVNTTNGADDLLVAEA